MNLTDSATQDGGRRGDSGYTGLDKREKMKRKRTLRYLIAEKPSKLKQIKKNAN